MPDINYINGKYVMYYSMSVWRGEQTCGIGVATARNPFNHFTKLSATIKIYTFGGQLIKSFDLI